MQVAHGVDLEDVREDGHHEHVRDEAERVAFEVAQEVERAHKARQHVDRQHDNASQTQRAEVCLRRGHVLPLAGIFCALGH